MTKLQMLTDHIKAGEIRKALRIASKFQELGEHKVRIQKAWSALMNPDFYEAIGQHPNELVADGVAAIKERYSL